LSQLVAHIVYLLFFGPAGECRLEKEKSEDKEEDDDFQEYQSP
jgi:hypothetical protein